MDAFNWTSPHCERDVTIVHTNYSGESHALYVDNATGYHALTSEFIVCPNPECRKYTLSTTLCETDKYQSGKRVASTPIRRWRLEPRGKAHAFPDYVPQAIRNDYVEACSIVDLSPKSAATLARRAVQGVVRDFWGVPNDNLFMALKVLDTLIGKVNGISKETWESMDAVRRIGNIGAHMEKDINIIVDVDPDEAQLLIELVEILIKDTYVARHARQQHGARLRALSQQKEAERKGPGP